MTRKKRAAKFIPVADLAYAMGTLVGFLKRESEREMLPYFFPDIKRISFEMRKDGNYNQVEATIFLPSGAARKFGIDIENGGVFWEQFKPAGKRKFQLVDDHFRGDE
jgi:hypothetical protein